MTGSPTLVLVLAMGGLQAIAAAPAAAQTEAAAPVTQSPAPGGAQAPAATATDQPPTPTTPGREFFISWGYNGDSYADSDMHFSQPTLGNDFTLASVQARDSKAWTHLFSHDLFVPQYNLHFGYFFNAKWGLEIALDHIKWIVVQGQQVPLTGTLHGAPANAQVTLTTDVLRYQLNNGANPIFFNAVRRVRLAGEPGHTGSLSLLAKAGGGFAVPHTDNAVFGQPNEEGFQFFHGWDLDADLGLRFNPFRRFYVEFEDKLIYAGYHGVNIDQGKAHHNVKANEFIFNFGIGIGR
jgi:hypothetical protein